MPPAYVKPYIKRHTNDAIDAEAICEAVTRANMRFVATKTPEQQSCLTLHRTRHLLIRQQTSVINAMRAHVAEFGIVAPVGRQGVEQLLGVVADASDKRLPEVARACVAALGAQLRVLKAQILEFDRMIRAWHRSSEASKRLDAIPGVGPALATCAYRKARFEHIGGATHRPWMRHDTADLLDWAWNAPCPMNGVFSLNCSSQRKISGFGANAAHPVL
jgi:transposase